MKKILLFIVLASYGFAGFSSTFTISNSGTTFTPETIIVKLGDIVDFNIAGIHNAVEVSQTTWNANGNSPLSGGFSVPFGGGSVPADKLTLGIHYYVCTSHAAFGMKGTITVLDPTGIADNTVEPEVTIFPNPSNGNFRLQVKKSQSAKKFDLGIYTMKGEKVYSKTDLQQQNANNIEIPDLPKGVYILRLYGVKGNYTRKIVVQ
jgi:plastocyanin